MTTPEVTTVITSSTPLDLLSNWLDRGGYGSYNPWSSGRYRAQKPIIPTKAQVQRAVLALDMLACQGDDWEDTIASLVTGRVNLLAAIANYVATTATDWDNWREIYAEAAQLLRELYL